MVETTGSCNAVIIFMTVFIGHKTKTDNCMNLLIFLKDRVTQFAFDRNLPGNIY